MANRKKYYHEWYLENKEHRIYKQYKWLEKKKKELGVKGFKKWKSEQNKKYRQKIKKTK